MILNIYFTVDARIKYVYNVINKIKKEKNCGEGFRDSKENKEKWML